MLSTISGDSECGGSTLELSPECTPASSMCCMTPPMTQRLPSATQSTSTSMASLRNSSTSTVCVPASRAASNARATKTSSSSRDVRDHHRAAAEHVARAHEHRDSRRSSAIVCASARCARDAAARALEGELGEHLVESPAVLGAIDGVGRRAEQLHAALLERHRELERRLPPELHDDPLGLLLLDDVEHVLERQRLEVEAVGRVVVGRHRLGIAVDHHGLESQLAQRHHGVHAAVVELDALPDAVGPAAQDDHLAAPRVGVRSRSRSRRSSRDTACAPRTRRRRCRRARRRRGSRRPARAARTSSSQPPASAAICRSLKPRRL